MTSFFSAQGRRMRRAASALSLALVAGLLVVLALKNDGAPITEVTYNDGSVWVTNTKDGLIGRLNPQIEELDLGLTSPTATFDIKQRGTSLFADGQFGSTGAGLWTIDVAKAVGEDVSELPSGSRVTYGAGVFAIFNPSTGRAWVRPEKSLATITPKDKDVAAENVVAATVGTDGTAWFAHADGTVSSVAVGPDGVLQKSEAGKLPQPPGPNLEMTVVGTTVVVLDVDSSLLLVPGKDDAVALNEADTSRVHLQEPSAAADTVIVGTGTNVLQVSLDDGSSKGLRESLTLPGAINGEPAPPVIVEGCVYSAWADTTPGAANFLRDCADDQDDSAEALGGEVQSGASLRFRVNRQVVVLNDTYTGDTWMVQQPGHKKVTNWDSIDPLKQNKPSQKKIAEEVHSEVNRNPVPQDDKLSVRLNRPSILPIVALNDYDPDGDIITITKVDASQSTIDLKPKIVSNATQLQVTAAQAGTTTLTYTVKDGNGGSATAKVTVTALKDGATNQLPRMMPNRKPRLAVVPGKSASLYLLADFYDPDGDGLILTDARSSGGSVEFRPDGTLQFTDNGKGAGVKEIQYTIEDGFSGTFTGKLMVDVIAGKPELKLVADLKSGIPNTKVIVEPLLNDPNPEGGELELERVKVRGDSTGTTIEPDLNKGTFTFTAKKAGSYYIDYRAFSPSGQQGTSFVRFDVNSPPTRNVAPIAVGDKAAIAPGGTTEADLLLNDIDEDADVLVVTKVKSKTPGVKVSVVDKRVAVISSSVDLSRKPAQVEYSVSDGHSSVEGYLTVSQRSAAQEASPIANLDQLTVREGTVATAPVLDNDSDPDGGTLRLTSVKAEPAKDGSKLDIWISDDVVRFKAPTLTKGKAMSYLAIYAITDAGGRKATAEIKVFVTPDDPQDNDAPSPAPIIERAVAGQPKVIDVDLSGSDPDGDAVTFSRVLTAPKRGRILETGAGWIRYEAYPNHTGTDYFQLEVRDKYGKTGVVPIWVGVVPRLEEDQPPVALDDAITVRPNRRVAVYALGNDMDPDDDRLQIGELQAAKSLKAEQKNGFIHVDVPELDGEKSATATVGYQLLDEARQSDNALLKIEAREDAPLYAPVAQDDIVELSDMVGKKPGDTVEVKPLRNDLDVDGSPDQLELTGCRPQTACRSVGDTLHLTLAQQDQTVIYDLADGDKESPDTSGVVFVRGTESMPPTFDPSLPLEVVSGQPLTINLAQVVDTRANRSPSLVPGSPPETINGTTLKTEVANQLVFTSNRAYFGPASISVSVTDATGPTDDQALTSVVTIPVNVLPAGNVPPTVRSATVTVSQDAPVELDLAGLVRDVKPKVAVPEMGYTVQDVTGPVAASLDGTLLTIEAKDDTEGSGRVTFLVDDLEGAAPVTSTVNVVVVASNRPLAKVPDRAVDADRGKRVSVDIADYAQNPYAAESKPLEVSGPGKVEGADQSAISDFTADGTRVSFVPEKTGVFSVRFSVSDASGDSQRNVAGRIKVSVAAVPDQPTRPEVSSLQPRSAVLRWREPNPNGAPITEYKVKGSNNFSTTCVDTTCPLNGLEPGVKYSFQVAAVNVKGTSAWSDPSEVVEPNQVPEIMTPPLVDPSPKGRDKRLTLRWSPPENEGSAIINYVLKWNGGSKTLGAVTSYTLGGLENGTAYMFSIHAVNKAGPGSESPSSDAEIPFGKPLAPGSVPVLTPSTEGTNPQVEVSWEAPDPNGDAITQYAVYCGGCDQSRYVTDKTSLTFHAGHGIANGHVYTFRVAAINKAGEGAQGPSDSARPYKPAAPVRNLRYVGSPSDRTATIEFGQPDLGGLPLKHYVVTVNDRPFTTTRKTGRLNLTFGANDVYRVGVWAVTMQGNTGDVIGAPSRVDEVRTWGQPGIPVGNTWSSSHYSVNLTAAPGTENGQRIAGVEVLDQGAWRPSREVDPEVEVTYGGENACRTFRTVSEAPDAARRYSDPKQVCDVSMKRVVNKVEQGRQGYDEADARPCYTPGFLGCENISGEVSGEGFKRESTLNITWPAPKAGTCPTTVVTDRFGNFSQSTDGACWFDSQNFSVAVTVDGIDSVS